MNIFATLSGIFINAYILFCFVLGIWAGVIAIRKRNIGGDFWGAMWIGAGMAAIGLLFWLARTLAGEELRWVYLWYQLYFIIVLPGTFALLRGRDDPTAAWIFCGVAIFTALAAMSANDPTRHVIAPISITPTPSG